MSQIFLVIRLPTDADNRGLAISLTTLARVASLKRFLSFLDRLANLLRTVAIRKYQQLIKIVAKFPKEVVIAGGDAGVSDLISRVKCEFRG